MASPTRWTWIWANSGSWWWKGREAWRAAVHGLAKSQTQLSDWTDWLKAGSWLSTLRITNKKDSIRAIVNIKIRFCLPAPCFPLVQCAVTVIPVFWKELKVYPCWPVMNQVDLWNVPLTGSQEHLAIIDCESAWRPSLEWCLIECQCTSEDKSKLYPVWCLGSGANAKCLGKNPQPSDSKISIFPNISWW